MSAARDQLLGEIVSAACELDHDDRVKFLDEACHGAAELRRDAERLLADDAQLLDLFDENDLHERVDRIIQEEMIKGEIDARPPDGTGDAPVPKAIAGYKILGRIGAGGMGEVYEAEQESPRRRVALKVVRPGLVSSDMLRRFRLEAETLGRLQHPGIARIYEARTQHDERGLQPYFVMEYIEGLPLGKYLKRHRLSVAQRLRMFIQICDAVEHAHQKGVIHRDLKPDNILVSADGRPTIVDFGVARFTEVNLGSGTAQTDAGTLIGTITYMSPEQVGGRLHELDTRSDVYTLGVILFELLAGRRLYDFSGCSLPAAARIIQEEQPVPLGAVNRGMRGDLETIVGKALEKTSDRRYPSASTLADDIHHVLRHEPISAHPTNALYQLRKCVLRHKALFSGIASAFLMLVATIIVSVLLLLRAQAAEERVIAETNRTREQMERARDAQHLARQRLAAAEAARIDADESARRTRAMTEFLFEILLEMDVAERDGREVTLREVIAKAHGPVADDPEIGAALRRQIGRILRAREQKVTELGADNHAASTARSTLGDALQELSRHAEVMTHLEQLSETLEWTRRPYDELASSALRGLAGPRVDQR